MDVALAAY